MFVKVYDKSLNCIGVISDLKYTLTRRIFDLDTGNFEGISDKDITNGVIFELIDELKDDNDVMYSGIMKNIKQENEEVSFKVEDFKKILDSEVVLDFSNYSMGDHFGYQLRTLFDFIFTKTFEANEKNENIIHTSYGVVAAGLDDVTWMGNYYGEFMIVNALSFMKMYLAYYNLYIKTNYWFPPEVTAVGFKQLSLVLYDQNTTTKNITLEDFEFNQTFSDVKTNHTIAYIEFDNIDEENNAYIKTSQTYYDNQPSGNKDSYSGYEDNPEVIFGSANQYPIGYCFKLEVLDADLPHHPTKFFAYYVIQFSVVPRPELPVTHYYLGNDNNIYQDDIPYNKLIWPITTKSFQAPFLAQAQAAALKELVDARYNENIILDNTNELIDFETVSLGDHFLINNQKVLPVSEIETNDEGSIKIKLGFKKTLFTEVVKKR